MRGKSRLRLALATVATTVLLADGCGTTVPLSEGRSAGSGQISSAGAPGLNGPTAPVTGRMTGDSAGEAGAAGTPAAGQDGTGPGPQSPGSRSSAPGRSPAGADQTGGSGLGPTRSGGGSRGVPPVTIGVVYSNNGAANSALGLATSASVDAKTAISALIGALDKQGGLAGHQIAVDYYAIDATSSDYSTQANAACANFTQDHRVPVVLDFSFGTRFGMAGCLARFGVADFGIGTSDTVADDSAGLFAAPDWVTSSRRYLAVIAGLHATGYLTARNRIGVLLEDCGYLQRAYQQTVAPEISQLDLTLADVETFSCTTGFSSAGPASASVSSAILHFRSDGVDRVLLVSDYEQVALLLLANQAESQGWRPGYMLSSAAETEVVRADLPSGQWPQLHGIGWSPGLDIDDPHQPLPPADQRCLDLIKVGGVIVSGWQNTFTATASCAQVFFLGAALQQSGGDVSGRALMAAVDSLGTSFVAPGTVDGRTSFGTTHRDGPAAEAPFGYVTSCTCMKYTGSPFAVP